MNTTPGWTEKRLDAVVSLRRGYDLPATSRKPGRYRVLSSGGVSGTHCEARVLGPGFSIGRATNLGMPTWSDDDYWPLNTTLFVEDFHGNVPRFCYYLFQSLDLTGFNSGSVQPMLNRNYIAGVKLAIPPIEEQRGIAATLGALDDKIESNARIRSTLRSLGKAQIDRVLARAGAHEFLLGDLAESIARGVTPKYAEDDSVPVLNQRCIRNGFVDATLARAMRRRSTPSAKLAVKGDVLVNSTGVGTLGRVARWHGEETNVDSHVTVVRPDRNRVQPTVLAYLLLARTADIEALATGSTGQTELSTSRLGELPVRVPNPADANKLEPLLLAFEEQIAATFRENALLAELRDTLIPELMSGRIRVPEAREVVDAAG